MSTDHFKTSIHHECPLCQRPLLTQAEGSAVLLWCGNGKCDDVANAGAAGQSEAAAFASLEGACENVPERERTERADPTYGMPKSEIRLNKIRRGIW